MPHCLTHARDPGLPGASQIARWHLRFGKRGEGAIAPGSAEKAVTLFKFYSNGVLIACQPAAGCLAVNGRHAEQSRQPLRSGPIGWPSVRGTAGAAAAAEFLLTRCAGSANNPPHFLSPTRRVARRAGAVHFGSRLVRAFRGGNSSYRLFKAAVCRQVLVNAPSSRRHARPITHWPPAGSAAAWLVSGGRRGPAQSPKSTSTNVRGQRVTGQRSADQRAKDQRSQVQTARSRRAGAGGTTAGTVGGFGTERSRSPARKTRTIRSPTACNRSSRGRSARGSAPPPKADRHLATASPRPSRSIRRWGRPSHRHLPSDCLSPTDQPTLQWTNPYETGPAEPAAATGWYRFMPLGMIPWGPRTPLAAAAVGWGQPLLGTSWLNRPWSAGWFAGGDLLVRH